VWTTTDNIYWIAFIFRYMVFDPFSGILRTTSVSREAEYYNIYRYMKTVNKNLITNITRPKAICTDTQKLACRRV
jgi:hypothetical protein